ncbi:MAG: sensory transduction histidine kinase [Myxococcales bacterium]|nr:sensory transduction histidine kinase [Myxococcales bacterium]
MTEGTHPLLGRLLRKLGASQAEVPSLEAWQGLLKLVGRTYQEADQDRYTLERSIEISSREMQGLYEALKRQSETELAAERQRVMQSLAILRATLEATVDGILVVDEKRRVVAANKRIGELLRIPEEVMETRDHHTIVEHASVRYPDPKAMIAESERLHASREILHDETTLKDGRTIDRYSAPVALLDGNIVGRVTFLRDISAERNAHAQLEHARIAAEAASQAKSNFLATMSHELRTPLNAVIGLSDLLLLQGGDPLSGKQREYLEGIVTSGRHLLSMVNDVLDLAKIEAGKQQLEIEPVGTQDAIEEAVHALRPIAASRGVALEAQVAPETPQVKADPIRLRQILYNLISNAVKFTNAAGFVRVSAAVDGRGVAIRVSDTGIGIAPDDVKRLFRAFEQVNLPSGDRPGGTGLGLALTKQLVDMHGGSIDVTSQLGHGTTFTVHLPVA